MYIGIYCIDSWHLVNGVHCPDLDWTVAEDIDTIIKRMKLRINGCIAYSNHVPLTPEYIKEQCQKDDGNCRIYFVKPREGYFQIINTGSYRPTIKVGSQIDTPNECELTVYAVDDSDFDDVTIKAAWMKKR